MRLTLPGMNVTALAADQNATASFLLAVEQEVGSWWPSSEQPEQVYAVLAPGTNEVSIMATLPGGSDLDATGRAMAAEAPSLEQAIANLVEQLPSGVKVAGMHSGTRLSISRGPEDLVASFNRITRTTTTTTAPRPLNADRSDVRSATASLAIGLICAVFTFIACATSLGCLTVRRHHHTLDAKEKGGFKDPVGSSSSRSSAGTSVVLPDTERQVLASSPVTGRQALIDEVFSALDVNRRGCLGSAELIPFGYFVGFQGPDSQWPSEYGALCQHLGRDPAWGLDPDALATIVDDSSPLGCFCSNADLRLLLDRLNNPDQHSELTSENSVAPLRGLPSREPPAAALSPSQPQQAWQRDVSVSTVATDQVTSADRTVTSAGGTVILHEGTPGRGWSHDNILPSGMRNPESTQRSLGLVVHDDDIGFSL